MQPITRVTLQQLDEAAWFSRVGTNDTNVAMVLSSWPEAIETCSSVEWEDLRLDAANQIYARIMEGSTMTSRSFCRLVLFITRGARSVNVLFQSLCWLIA
jgi:hypothetical protein